MSALNMYNDLPTEIDALSKQVVDCLFHVHKELGPGYTEQIYEDALVLEFESRNISYERQKLLRIFYKGRAIRTEFHLDIVVENKILLELKAVEAIHLVHQSQVYAYLKASGFLLGFLVNFNVPLIKDGIKRYVNKHPS